MTDPEHSEDVQQCLDFIDAYWDQIILDPKDSRGDRYLIPLLYAFLTPNAKENSHWKRVMFYWDNFFMFRGLIGTRREWIIPQVVQNLAFLFKQFGIIPNANKWVYVNRSQPPFFSSMIFDAYSVLERTEGEASTKAWLQEYIDVAQEEYWTVWEDADRFYHKVHDFGLNRYGKYGLIAEMESGWDFTTRFYSRCHEFLPVDLNSYLHKYEKDFAETAHLLGKKQEETSWEDRAIQRQAAMKRYLWNEREGFFFDYDFRHGLRSEFYSLAGFMPLWAQLVTVEEAERMREKLPLFETDYGLTITAKSSLPPRLDLAQVPAALRSTIQAVLTPGQWDYPHIWAPLEYLTVTGLLRYGFVNDAVRIMKKSIAANVAIYKQHGALLEKIDSTTGGKGQATFVYPTQLGFGWTNAIFYDYVKTLDLFDQKEGKRDASGMKVLNYLTTL